MLEMFQLTQPSGYFQRTLVFQPQVTVLYLCSTRAGHTHSLGHRHPLALGEPGSALTFTCSHSYKSHQESSWQMCSMTPAQTQEEHLRPGHSLHGEALPRLLRWGARHTAENGARTRCAGLPSNSTRRGLPGGEVSFMRTTHKTLKLQNF